MSNELETLLKKKEIEKKKLEIADRENNLFLCLAIGDTLNKIDREIRKIASEDESVELHKKGLI